MKELDIAIEDILNVEAAGEEWGTIEFDGVKRRIVMLPEAYRAGALAVGNPLADALIEAIEQRNYWASEAFGYLPNLRTEDLAICAILKKGKA